MYSFVSNKFTESAMTLQNQSGYVPDVSYVSRKLELTAAYNLFYGKFRVTSDTVYYFDQYWALGAGRMDTGLGQEWAAVADAGLVLWLGKWGSARLGLKDYYYNEKTLFNSSMAHNLHGHLDVGYLF
jgi:outer membrane beta-barrel protein